MKPKSIERHPVMHDIDSVPAVIIKIDNLVFDHLRVGDDALSAALLQQRPLQTQDLAVFAVEVPENRLPWHLELFPALQPRLMHAVAGAINIAAQDSLEADQNIALKLWTDFFYF